MSLRINRAKVLTATTGTGTVTLGAAVLPFQTWAAAGASGTTRRYSYLIEDGNAWELGEGIFDTGLNTLTRVLVASSTGALLNLTGAATVSCVEKATDTIQLVEKVSLNSLAAYTFNDIPQTHSGLRLVLHAATTQAVVSANPAITVNGNSTGIYSTQRQFANVAVNTADQALLATSLGALIGGIPGTTVPAGTIGFIDMEFFEYANATFRKTGKFRARQPASATTTTAFSLHGAFEVNLTAPITSITITNAGGVNFANGSTASLTLLP